MDTSENGMYRLGGKMCSGHILYPMKFQFLFELNQLSVMWAYAYDEARQLN